MPTLYLKSITGTAGSGSGRTVWATNTAYVSGDRVVTTRSATGARQAKVYECTTGGTSHSTTEPTWDSTTGNTTSDGTVTWTCRAPTTWANAHMFLDMLTQGDAAEDIIYVSQAHNETSSANLNFSFAGTLASPTKVICANDGAEPPTTTANTGVIATTSTGTQSFGGNCFISGLTFNSGSGANNATVTMSSVGGEFQVFEDCNFQLVATGTGTFIDVGNEGNFQPSVITFNNCDVKLGAVTQGLRVRMGYFTWDGGSVISGSSAATSGLVRNYGTGDHSAIFVSGVDFTNLGVTGFVFTKTSASPVNTTFVNCTFPSFTTGGLLTGTLAAGDRVKSYNSDSADPSTAGHRLWIKDYFGDITSDTSVYNSDASPDDGLAVPWSWKMVASANTEFPHQVLKSDQLVRWNDTTGSSVTATVEIVHNSAGGGTNGALLDTEIWLEVMYYSASGSPLGSWTSDRCANLNLNSNAADQAASTVAWTGDAAGWDTQKLTVSFTPQEKGYVHARVCLALASATVYVDPNVTLA